MKSACKIFLNSAYKKDESLVKAWPETRELWDVDGHLVNQDFGPFVIIGFLIVVASDCK